MQQRLTPLAEAVLKILRRVEPSKEVRRLRWDIEYEWLTDDEIRARCADVVDLSRALRCAVA